MASEVIAATDVGDIRGQAGYEGVQVGDQVLCAIRPEAMDFLDESETADNVIFGARAACDLSGRKSSNFLSNWRAAIRSN